MAIMSPNAVAALQLSLRAAAAAAGVALLVLLAACASVPTDYPRTASTAYEHGEQTPLGRAFAPPAGAPEGASGLRLLASGVDAYAARVALAERAQRTLDLQYYIVHDDESTLALLARVAAAADRGVRVRLLVDDFDSLGRDAGIAAMSAHPNVEVRVFNPFARRGSRFGRVLEMLGDFDRLNHRMHNKLFVADNAAAVIGGRNLGNEYFGAPAEAGFVDLDVLVVGPAVRQASTSFDAFWSSVSAVPIEALMAKVPSEDDVRRALDTLQQAPQRLALSPYADRLRSGELVTRIAAGAVDLLWAPARAVYDPPAKAQGEDSRGMHIRPQLRPVLDAAQREVVLVSPYFVPGDAGVAFLRALHGRGVDVRVLTNSLAATDVPAAYAGYSKYQRALLDAGVALYELRAAGGGHEQQRRLVEELGAPRATLHAKTLVVDRRYVFIGSMNLDPRSDRLNTELGVLIDSPSVARDLLQDLDRLMTTRHSYRLEADHGGIAWVTQQDGVEVRSDTPPDTTTWQRFRSAVSSWIAPEELL
jgi:putative cardiolipin synthase